jgi:hypothetical protein
LSDGDLPDAGTGVEVQLDVAVAGESDVADLDEEQHVFGEG